MKLWRSFQMMISHFFFSVWRWWEEAMNGWLDAFQEVGAVGICERTNNLLVQGGPLLVISIRAHNSRKIGVKFHPSYQFTIATIYRDPITPFITIGSGSTLGSLQQFILFIFPRPLPKQPPHILTFSRKQHRLLGGWAPMTYGYVVKNHGDRFRPLRIRVMGPLPNGRTSWLKYMGVIRSPITNWDDPAGVTFPLTIPTSSMASERCQDAILKVSKKTLRGKQRAKLQGCLFEANTNATWMFRWKLGSMVSKWRIAHL